MRILMVNDLQVEGGAEVQHWREYDLLRSKGHEVYSLTFDGNVPLSDGPKFNIPIQQNDAQKLVTRAFRLGPKKKIHAVLDEVKPDLVHVNNVVKCPLAIYGALAKYPCVQTIRDYGAICPKSTCVHPDYSPCGGIKLADCSLCELSRIQTLKSKLMSGIEHARRACVDIFVAPSQALADACTRNGLETLCLNNPFDFSKLLERNIDFSSRGFLYYGGISENKGVGRLLEAFDRFSSVHPDASLMLAGRVAPEFRSQLEKALKVNKRIEYLGVLENDEMLRVLSCAYCVITPSLWIENYPNTVLEPLAAGVLVIGSNRGGIPELIQNNELLFDVTDITSITGCMERAYTLSEEQYRSITSASARRVRENNSLDRFYERLLDVFSCALQYKGGD